MLDLTTDIPDFRNVACIRLQAYFRLSQTSAFAPQASIRCACTFLYMSHNSSTATICYRRDMNLTKSGCSSSPPLPRQRTLFHFVTHRGSSITTIEALNCNFVSMTNSYGCLYTRLFIPKFKNACVKA